MTRAIILETVKEFIPVLTPSTLSVRLWIRTVCSIPSRFGIRFLPTRRPRRGVRLDRLELLKLKDIVDPVFPGILLRVCRAGFIPPSGPEAG